MTSPRLTVLHVRCAFYPGGPETTLIGWYRHADRSRFDQRIVVFDERRQLHERAVAFFAEQGVPVELIPWGWRRTLVAAVRALVGKIRAAGPCVLHAHDVRSDVVALLAGRLTGSPVVISNHAWHAQGLYRHVQEWARARWMRWADAVVSVSEDTHQGTLERGIPPDRALQIYSGLDLGPYRGLPPRAQLRAELGIPADAPVVSNVARAWPEKALPALIEACARLVPRHPGLQVLQVGDGPLLPELKAEVARRGLAANFRFLGFRTDYARVMAASDVFTLPSLAEGMPMVVYSAMAMGLPIVASTVSGVKDLLTDEANALLIAPGDAAGLTTALDRLLADPGLGQRLGDAARDLVESAYSAERAVQNFEALYARLHAGRVRTAPGGVAAAAGGAGP